MNYINNTNAPANTDTGSNEKGFFGKLLDTAKGHLNTAQDHFQKLTAPAPAPKKTAPAPTTAPTVMPITPQRSSESSLQNMVKRGGKRSKRNMRKKHGSKKHGSKKHTKRTRNRSKKSHKKR